MTQESDLAVEVRRSARRRRTVSAYVRDGRLVVLVPASFSAAQEAEWVARMRDKLERSSARRHRTDDDLTARARSLSRDHLGGRARPSSIRWVDNQASRWGSCTTTTGEIRISRAVAPLPIWVQDYVILHELAHLLEPGHGPRFWALLQSYPRLERARGYLSGYASAAGGAPAAADDEGC